MYQDQKGFQSLVAKQRTDVCFTAFLCIFHSVTSQIQTGHSPLDLEEKKKKKMEQQRAVRSR